MKTLFCVCVCVSIYMEKRLKVTNRLHLPLKSLTALKSLTTYNKAVTNFFQSFIKTGRQLTIINRPPLIFTPMRL
jgi:hypothetical protein